LKSGKGRVSAAPGGLRRWGPPGNRDKAGQAAVATFRSWRGSPACSPRPLAGRASCFASWRPQAVFFGKISSSRLPTMTGPALSTRPITKPWLDKPLRFP